MSNLVCLICCTPWVNLNEETQHFMDATQNNPENSNSEKQGLSAVTETEIFQVFCKHMNVNLELNPCQWTFPKEPLPFCPDCKETVSYILSLHSQLQNIQNELKSVVENVKFKIENSDENLEMTEVDKRITDFRLVLCKSVDSEYEQDVEKHPADSNGPRKTRRTRRAKPDAFYVELSGDSSDEHNVSSKRAKVDLNSDSNHSSQAGKSSKGRKVQYKDTDESYEDDGGDNSSDEDFDPGLTLQTPSQSGQDTVYITRPLRTVERTEEEGKFRYGGFEFTENNDGFKCCVCPNRGFKRKSGMLVHLRQVHLGERGNHTCHICGRLCDSPYSLKVHESTHTDVRNFNCTEPECNKSFKNSKNLKRHLLETHKLLLKFACPHCKNRFKTKELLDDHIVNTHDSPAPQGFYCDFCGKCFNRAAKVKEHQKIHRKDKFYKCTYCGTNFLQKENLKLHFFKDHGIKIE